MNALFGLRVRVTVGERLIVGVATATAVFLSALPTPPMPRVTSGGSGQDDERRRVEVQRLLHATIARNKECYGLKHVPAVIGLKCCFYRAQVVVVSLCCLRNTVQVSPTVRLGYLPENKTE